MCYWVMRRDGPILRWCDGCVQEPVREPGFWRLMDNAQMQGIRDPKERGVLRSTLQ
jgi:hypothetical protein